MVRTGRPGRQAGRHANAPLLGCFLAVVYVSACAGFYGQVYEKGIHLFSWPSVKDIWLAYLRDFVERYSGTKLERARDLFEQCVDDCPPEHAKTFYFLYAKLEVRVAILNEKCAGGRRVCGPCDTQCLTQCLYKWHCRRSTASSAMRWAFLIGQRRPFRRRIST